MSDATRPIHRVLVLGATGYVGGRLVPRLLRAGYEVRVLARSAARLEGRSWLDQVEVVVGDALDEATLAPAFAGVDAAYYLIHSMRAGSSFHDTDLVAARHCGRAASDAGVARLLYLGGLGDPDTDLSEHLRSRHQTGSALAEAGVPVTEFRAGVIVGSGSLSFEIVRNLTERIPIMTCPRWVYVKTQPISIRNVLAYLVDALRVLESAGRVIEIGGADTITYGDMMKVYAQVRGLRRLLVPVPVLTPRLSSYWVHWTTPAPATVARPLIEGLRNEAIVRDDVARTLFPHIEPDSYETAVKRALARLKAGVVESTFNDALVTSLERGAPVLLEYREGMIREIRARRTTATPAHVFAQYTRLGGDHGWPVWNWAWRLRGMIDRLLGGVGFRRGRRCQTELRVGDAVDFWRVEAVEPGSLLRLRAEMRLPGRAWLEFRSTPVEDDDSNGANVLQTAYFDPKGLFGLVYWYSLYPFHRVIFSAMIDRICARAERADAA